MSWSTWNFAESDAITIPTHAKGDLIVIVAARGDSGALATIPAGWLVANARSLNSPAKSFLLAYKVATSSAETSGTWTNAQLLACGVWAGTSVHAMQGPFNNANGAANATVTYGNVLPQSATSAAAATRMQQASGYLLGVAFSKQINSGIESPPSGMDLVANGQGVSANQIAVHETTAAVSSWANTTVAVANNIDWITLMIERVDIGYVAAGGGMLIHPGMSGGMRG